MTGTMRIRAGNGTSTEGRIADLACRLRDHAKRIGLRTEGVLVSRNTRSNSRYLHVRDAGRRRWVVRVADHELPAGASYDPVHLDFVSYDAVSGKADACAWLDRVAAGLIEWTDPKVGGRRPRRRR